MNPPASLELIQTPVDPLAVGMISISFFVNFVAWYMTHILIKHCWYFSGSLDVAVRAAAEENKRKEEVLRWLSSMRTCPVLTLCWHQHWRILGLKGHSWRRNSQKTMMLTQMKPLPEIVVLNGVQGEKNSQNHIIVDGCWKVKLYW